MPATGFSGELGATSPRFCDRFEDALYANITKSQSDFSHKGYCVVVILTVLFLGFPVIRAGRMSQHFLFSLWK